MNCKRENGFAMVSSPPAEEYAHRDIPSHNYFKSSAK